MSPDYEQGRTNLGSLITQVGPRGDRNEATTRLQLIDRLFFDCLGWSTDDVVLEEPHGRTFADYVFSAPRRLLIVEAKREGDYFEIPAGKIGVEGPLPSLLRDFPSTKDAALQVSGYCQQRGVPFAAIANGHQIVAFIANRSDGIAPLSGKAIIFDSLETMHVNFFNLWQALSKRAVEQKLLQRTLLGQGAAEVPPKLSTLITNYPGTKGRNVLQTDLQVLSELLIEDVPNTPAVRPQFLRDCYCTSGALAQHALVARTILESKYAQFTDGNSPAPLLSPAVTKKGISPDLLTQSLTRRPILLIGDVGVGKTTFLQHLMDVEAAGLFTDAITLYINLGSQATLTADLRSFIPKEMSTQLRDKYGVDIEESSFVRAVYNVELSRFGKGIYAELQETNPSLYREKQIGFLEAKLADYNEHVKSSLQHIAKGRKKQIIVILDNADQRIESTIQQQAFLIAQEIAEHWPATVFVALRPETFHSSVRTGAMSGYHPKAFTVSPPRLDLVISKRLWFAIKLASGEITIPILADLNPAKIGVIMRSFVYSLEDNLDLLECLENIAGTNIRLALDLVRNFFGSGHVDTESILQRGDRYRVPLHQFLRAVLYGDHEYYDPDRSPLANLFDVSQSAAREHFILPLLLAFLGAKSSSELEGGFVEIEAVYERLQSIGFTPDQIDQAIIRATRKKLIETAGRVMPTTDTKMPRALRWTTIGAYHAMRLCKRFEYIDAMIVDTPILFTAFRKHIHDVRDIRHRVERGKVFLEYLDDQWTKVGGSIASWDWPTMSTAVKAQIAEIEGRI